MDMSLVAAILSQQQGAFQSQVATTVLKQNLDQQKSDVLTSAALSSRWPMSAQGSAEI